MRIVLGPEGEAVPDLKGTSFGRGAWIHPTIGCIEKAAPRGLSRSFRCRVRTGAEELRNAVALAADARATALIACAGRAGEIAPGSDAVREALADGRARLVIVAVDARAAAQTPWVQRAVAEGRALAWGTKALIGEAVGRRDTGVVAILEAGLARALEQTISMSQIPPTKQGEKR